MDNVMNKELVIHAIIGAAAVAAIYLAWKNIRLTTTPGGSVLMSPTGENLGVPAPGSQLAGEASQFMNYEMSSYGDLMQQ